MPLSNAEVVILALVGCPFFYVASCAHISLNRQEAFKSIKIGDSADTVLKHLGPPSVKERPEKLFSRFANTGCEAPCAERWWFENTMGLDIEAWSVWLDADGKVLEKYHWVSP